MNNKTITLTEAEAKEAFIALSLHYDHCCNRADMFRKACEYGKASNFERVCVALSNVMDKLCKA